jgi:hypothetical protein
MSLYFGLRLAPSTFVVADFVAPGTDGDQVPGTFDSIQAFGPTPSLGWHATWVAVPATPFPPK